MEFSVVGKSLPKTDTLEKATGRAIYIDDLVLPGMLCGKILRSPYAHARILQIDCSRAKRLPGVKAVLTGSDVPQARMGAFILDEPILAQGVVRHVGEPVAAVAAVDENTAKDALELISVEYEELPAVFDPLLAMEEGAPIIHGDFAGYAKVFNPVWRGNLCSHTTFLEGDVELGFKQADLVLEDTFRTQMVHQCYMEACGAIASVDISGKVTVWTTTQSVFVTQARIHQSLGLPMSKIRVIGTRVGGAFGGKVEATVQPVCVALSQVAFRPVKIILERDEEFTSLRPRHPAVINIKTGAKKDGHIVAKEVRIVFDTGAYADDGPGIAGFGAMMSRGPYRIPNVKIEGLCVYTNKIKCGAFRGFGNPQGTFASESQLDEIAHQLGIDPLEIRALNGVETGDRALGGNPYGSVGYKECLKRAGDAIGWGKPKEKNRGRGMASINHISGIVSSAATVKMNEDGTVVLLTGAMDIGQGSDTTLSQMAAEELGVPYEHVSIVTSDSETTPYNWATTASRTVYTAGNAVRMAAREAKKQVISLAADCLEANPQDLETREGYVFVAGSPERKIPFRDIAGMSLWAKQGPILGSASFMVEGPPFDAKRAVVMGYPFGAMTAYIFGVHMVEVEVDTETGHVRIVNSVAAHDVGKAINPAVVEGQIQGGFVQGVGYALMEEMILDDGKVTNPSMVDYRIPSALDVPKVIPIIVETGEPTGPFGAKGVGECGLVGTAPAIANAIYDAVGVRIKELPLTPERVLQALKNKKTARTDWI
ncbi:MAG: xanthine dehydrogenase family protein molybdopterin-binding subunit [Deltaproteobacteria bacterium]|nr:xanthine dehydrogenase family protein molybdopterin-binding subunit [Deltaproteobacteria bacterium]